jgi:hypothetical protein
MKQLLRGRSGRKNTANATLKMSGSNSKYGWNPVNQKVVPSKNNSTFTKKSSEEKK